MSGQMTDYVLLGTFGDQIQTATATQNAKHVLDPRGIQFGRNHDNECDPFV